MSDARSPGSARWTRRAMLRAGLALPTAALLGGCTTQAPSDESASTPSTPTGGAAAMPFASPRKPEGEIFIQIVTNGISPFWDPMAEGMRRMAAELGCKADWYGPQPAEVSSQKKFIEQALAKGVDGIALSCIEPKASVPIIEMVLDKGVPIITFDADSPESRRLCYIGTNNIEAGKAAGEAAVRLLPEGGKFVAFVGNIDAQNARERKEGFEAVARPHGIEIVQVYDDNKDANRAQQNVEQALVRYGNEIRGLLGLFSYNPPRIARVLEQKGLVGKYVVVAFDAEVATQEALQKGVVHATVVQKPFEFGRLSVQLLYLINRKGWPVARQEMNIPASGIYDTGVDVVVPDNSPLLTSLPRCIGIAAFRKRLQEIGVEQS